MRGSTHPGNRRAHALAWLLVLLMGVPLLASTAGAIAAGWSPSAWSDLIGDPQLPWAVALTLWSGVVSSVISVLVSRALLSSTFASRAWPAMVRTLSPMLAMPHVAFAIGLAFLISPGGWLLRAVSPWATGLQSPPPWLTTQDPWGLGLIAVLVAKEVPFLLWAATTVLQRPDVAQRHRRELQIAHSLGYSHQRAWRLVLWPQLWPRLHWPMLAVLVYSLTVVDMALVIGPTSPPTLAVLAWQWLLDADASRNAQGAAAAWLLAGMAIVAATLAKALTGLSFLRDRWTSGQRGAASTRPHAAMDPAGAGVFRRASTWWHTFGAATLLAAPYLAVMLALAVGSVAGIWPFPALLPRTLSLQAWQSVASSVATIGTTLTLALSSALAGLIWVVAWLEWAPRQWQALIQRIIYLPLLLPPVLWVVGVHGAALRAGLDASWLGVALAHTLSSAPYVLIALSPAYTGFDNRLQRVTASLGHGRLVFLLRVKWPLLRAALASAFAIGFAVSVAQYLPTAFVGGGRINTVSTEAITLAAGAQRSLTAAYAWLQWLLPVLVFALASHLGQPKRLTQS
jgi:putative thiamine transport system permease protein